MTVSLRGEAAIVGVGWTEFSPSSPKSGMRLTAEAFKAALADAGVARDEVDGITTHLGHPYGDDYDRMASGLGLNIRHAAQYFSHGRYVTLALQNAATAVVTSMADIVACVLTWKNDCLTGLNSPGVPGAGDREGAREGGGPHGQEPAFGLSSIAAGAALSMRRYMQIYGVEGDALMPVVLSAHAHAARNPLALRHGNPLSREQYLAQPFSMDPLRKADGALFGDGSVVILVATAEKARTLRKPPVYIRGMQGMRTGREEFLFGKRGLGVHQQGVNGETPEPHPHQVFEMAGAEASQIDAFYTYDIYAPMVLFALERFGHCAPGQAAGFAASGAIGPGGSLPVNTNGGMLAEQHLSGWATMAEITRQLRQEAGPTQVPQAKLVQWGTTWGDSIIFGSEP